MEDVEELSIEEVINKIWLDLAAMIEESGVRLDIDVSDCPPIRFSAKNMRSIFYNLLSNAIKYRSPKRQPVVRVRCEETSDYQVLTVADNGLGMDMKEKHKIFAMFKRLHDHIEGTGLGLYIIKKIIENAGGKIDVESQVDVGSTFKVYFNR